jgi:cytochrome c-type biogenesis protein CcmH
MLLVSGYVSGVEESYVFSSEQQRELFAELSAELRCPKCQNQSIGDSDAMIATDLRRKLYQLVEQGKTRDQIIQFMKQRYGEFVHYHPPVNPLTIWLWLLPLCFVIITLLWLYKQSRSQSNTQTDALSLAKADALLNQTEAEQPDSKVDQQQ